MAGIIPEVEMNSGTKPLPVIGMGTATYPFPPPETTRSAVLCAIRLGYRHFDTAAVYQSERPVGEAIAEALRTRAVGSRDELFITSKLWACDCHGDLVLPALQNTLRNLGLEYLDLYLVHWPARMIPGKYQFPSSPEDLLPFDMSSVWAAMEECRKMGLTKDIGVSNFSRKKLEALLSTAKVPPAVNQVEVNPVWQQKELREFCLGKGIRLCAYSPLGARGVFWGHDMVMECRVLKQIAEAKGKTVAQVCLRWIYEQGDCMVVKSFNEKRLKENLDIFNWELDEEDRHKINTQIEQHKGSTGLAFVSPTGQYKSLEEFWDDVI